MLGQTFQPDFGERQMKKRDKYFYDTIFRRPSGDVTLEVRLQPDDKITKFLDSSDYDSERNDNNNNDDDNNDNDDNNDDNDDNEVPGKYTVTIFGEVSGFAVNNKDKFLDIRATMHHATMHSAHHSITCFTRVMSTSPPGW